MGVAGSCLQLNPNFISCVFANIELDVGSCLNTSAQPENGNELVESGVFAEFHGA